MKHIYCCLFDKNYSVKGLSMIQSLQKFDPSARIFVLALDKYTERLILKLKERNINLITLVQIEDENVLTAKGNRGLVEYYWTLSSVLTAYVFEKYNSEFDTLTYLDSDIFFYSDPNIIFSQIKQNTSCIITPHNFSSRLMDRIVNGKFCVQWVTFVNNQVGKKVLFDWRSDCLDWCYYKLEDGKMGDQKYLDYWPERYEGVVIDGNLGAGVAPWNYEDISFSEDDGKIFANASPLIFYHFHQFTHIARDRYDRLSKFYTDVCDVPESIYVLYEDVSTKNYEEIEALMHEVPYNFTSIKKTSLLLRRIVQTYFPNWMKALLRRIKRY